MHHKNIKPTINRYEYDMAGLMNVFVFRNRFQNRFRRIDDRNDLLHLMDENSGIAIELFHLRMFPLSYSCL